MKQADLQLLVAQRLEDMADQVERLYAQGEPELAEFLRNEGLLFAEAYDNEEIFMYIGGVAGA